MRHPFNRVSAAALLRKFSQDQRGGLVERLAIGCGLLTFSCVVTAHMLDYAAKNGQLPTIAFSRSHSDLAKMAQSMPRPTDSGTQSFAGNGIDMNTTASIADRARAVLIDPCTGKPR